jgi:hypothetical protein
MSRIQYDPDQLELFNPQKFTRHQDILAPHSVQEVMEKIEHRILEINDDIVSLNEEELILNSHKRSA